MNILRIPKKGEISSWKFFLVSGRRITININFKGMPNPLRKSIKQTLPPGGQLKYHPETDAWYITGVKYDPKSVVKVLNYIHQKLALGMNREELERALPEFFPDQSALDIKAILKQYLEDRKVGTRFTKKANEATLKGIGAVNTAWGRYGADMDLALFRKGVTPDSQDEDQFYKIIYNFIEYLRELNKSPATQRNYIFYLKDALKVAAKYHGIALPDISEINTGIQIKNAPIVIDNAATLKALAELDPKSFESPVQQEAALVSKLMYAFGYRIGDAAMVTRKNIEITDQGVFIKMYSQKHKVPTRHLVPDNLWEDLQYFFAKWGGRVLYKEPGAHDQRLRRNIDAIVRTLPGMNDPIQVLRQRSDGSTFLEWTTMAEEFVPHVFRKTSGTQYHLLTGNGSSHLGNTQAVFNRHYMDRSAIDVEREKEFHKRLGL